MSDKRARKKSHRLSVMLLKSSVSGCEDALKEEKHAKSLSLDIGGIPASLYYKQNPQNAPSWVKLFKQSVGDSLDELKNSGTLAALLLTCSKRIFALTFGYGRSLLKPDCYEENFGLKVVLNTVDPDKLRSVDAHTLDAVPVHQRSQASVETNLDNFGFNTEQDMIYGATGKSQNAFFGKNITGKDALTLSVPIELSDLPSLLAKLLEQFESNRYKEYFGWLDNLSEVRDREKLQKLDKALGEKIAQSDFNRTWLAVPDVLDWSDFRGFRYPGRRKDELIDDISWASYMDSLPGSDPITAETFRKHSVCCISESSEQVTHEWPLYRCIYCELELNKHCYALSNGKWYRVDADYLKQLESDCSLIPLSDLALPDYYEDASEGDYNERVYKREPDKFALMDKKNIHFGGGKSQIEFCDLYTAKKQLIHVKRYGGSSVLSHLFAQGIVSAELLLSDDNFRSKVNEKLPKSFQINNPPEASDFEVVYAIASRTTARSEMPAIPLFSKINLRNCYKRLRLMKVRASVCVIPVKSALAETDS
jgi:uncharacterized protein (TIGR04141 family)